MRATAARAGRFRPERLLNLADIIRAEFPEARFRYGRAMVRCVIPGHDDSTASLSIDTRPTKARLHCFGCCWHGDIFDFVRVRYNLSDFCSAARMLGCWNEGPLSQEQRREIDIQKREHERIKRQAKELADEERRLRLEIRGELHTYEQIMLLCHRNANDDGWHELAFEAASARLSSAAGYYALAFGGPETKARYTLNEQARAEIEAEILRNGFVHDGTRLQEVCLW